MVDDARLAIDGARIEAELAHLGTFTEAPPPAVTRVLWTPTDLAGRAYVRTLLEAEGLMIRTDPIGTIFARWHGTEGSLAPVATGSHVDAIPNAGRYDGCYGVVGAIEALRGLRRAGFVPRRSIDVVVFASEEPTRFGVGCLGSRLMTGAMSADAARALRDADGVSVEDARLAAGHGGDLEAVRLSPGEIAAFLELHIEQGPVLEQLGIPVGIVTAIAAPTTLRVTVHGEGGHAGALLMADRHDALAAAAEVVLAVERTAHASGSTDTVGTVGQMAVFPGAVNGVPSRVDLSVDVRDIDGARRDATVGAILASMNEVAARRGVRIEVATLSDDPPATMDPWLVDVLDVAANDAGVATHRLPSRAYHDSLFMPRACPTAMLFVPCRDGVSHRPDEFATEADMADGVRVLAHALARLST
ncbi:MAG: M20 family metallo-hydrolase [Chloroflexota bacterium]